MASDIDILLWELRSSSVENITNEMIFELYYIGKSKSYKYQDIVYVLEEECEVDQFSGRVANLRKLIRTPRGDAASSLKKKNPSGVFLVFLKLEQGHKRRVYHLHLKTL